MSDPKGYYALLGIGPDSPASAIHAAFRRKAKLLHPDVPVTGDLRAFLHVKEAYEVLSNTLRRNEYDRLARMRPPQPRVRPNRRVNFNSPQFWAHFDRPADDLEKSFPPEPPPPVPFIMPVRPRIIAWSGVALVVIAGISGAVWQFTRPKLVPHYSVSAMPSGNYGPVPPAEPPGSTPNLGPAMPFYIQPAAETAMVWRYSDTEHQYLAMGRIRPFTPVMMLRMVSHATLAELRLPDGQIGYVYPSLLVPGDAAAARRAACIFEAGPPPKNGEVLPPPRDAPGVHPAGGDGGTLVENTADQPAVISMRHGAEFAAVYIGAHARVRLVGLDPGAWQVDWASGDLWSRPCFRFMAGMRSRRLPEGELPPAIKLPADQGIGIPDQAFGR